MLEAKRQLRYTSTSVSEIAYGLGFGDPAYFMRFFSQRTDTAPRVFRSNSERSADSESPVGTRGRLRRLDQDKE